MQIISLLCCKSLTFHLQGHCVTFYVVLTRAIDPQNGNKNVPVCKKNNISFPTLVGKINFISYMYHVKINSFYSYCTQGLN